MKKKNIYNLLVDFRNTKDSVPTPINIALTEKEEADKFVKESKLGFHRIYEKITILEKADDIVPYLDTLMDATIFIKPAEVGDGKKSGLYKYRYGIQKLTNDQVSSKMQHMYLLSDEEIIEGDWYVNLDDGAVKNNLIKLANNAPSCKKIVATTDNKLNLPIIGEEFIKEYIEAKGKIEKVKYKIVKVNLQTWRGLMNVAVIYKR
jgi:hypothetical protein